MTMPRTPTAILQMRGSKRGNQRAKKEPQAIVPLHPCTAPDWLNENAKTHWREIHKTLLQMGVYSDSDKIALGLLCDSLGDYLFLKKEVEREGYVCYGEKGSCYQSPLVGMRNKSFEHLKGMLLQFGCTPASRANISVTGVDGNESTLDKLLG